jgi:hypothetical protein
MAKKVKENVVYCDDCQLRGIDGGPSPVMVCEHPEATDMGYIISCDSGSKHRISTRCPKLREN